MTGLFTNATFEACCCFCSIAYARETFQPPRTPDDGYPLEEKGHVRHQEQALRYVYLPTTPRDKARQSALRHMLATFFDNSTEQAIAALLSLKRGELARDNLDRLSALIEKAKKEGE